MSKKFGFLKFSTTVDIASVNYDKSAEIYESPNALNSTPAYKGKGSYDVFISSDLTANTSYSLSSTEDKNRATNMRLAGKFSTR